MVTKSDVFVLVLTSVFPNSGEVSNEKRLLHSTNSYKVFAKQYLKKGIINSKIFIATNQ